MNQIALHDLIEQMHAGIDFGTVQLTIKKHDSHITHVDGQKMTSHKTKGNEEAFALILQLLKAVQASQETGHMTFTIVLDKGVANRMIVQDVRRVAM